MNNLESEVFESWANHSTGPVALTARQRLVSVEGPDAVIFPPTYAGIGYNIDRLSDGTKVATIDSVGSQANRMEPLFRRAKLGERENPLASLVPQIEITYGTDKCVSILEVGHRLGDALIRSSSLAEEAHNAFNSYLERGDPELIARLAPTSLLFGVWDSRDTQAKFPRILQAVIRAWDVEKLSRSAQYGPPVNYAELEVFSETVQKKQEGNAKSPLAQRGFVHVPATREHGGVIVRDEIRRDITINLVALRRLGGPNGPRIRRYLLGLALVAATAPLDGFLRQGCLLTSDPGAKDEWFAIARNGDRTPFHIDADSALEIARKAASHFECSPRTVEFDAKRAKADAKKKV